MVSFLLRLKFQEVQFLNKHICCVLETKAMKTEESNRAGRKTKREERERKRDTEREREREGVPVSTISPLTDFALMRLDLSCSISNTS